MKDLMASQLEGGDLALTSELIQEVFSALTLVHGMPGVAEKVQSMKEFVHERAAVVSENDLLAIMSQTDGRIDISRVNACLKNLKKEELHHMKKFQEKIDQFLCMSVHQLLDKALCDKTSEQRSKPLWHSIVLVG